MATRWTRLLDRRLHNAMAYPALNALAASWADLTLVAQRHVTALGAAAASAPLAPDPGIQPAGDGLEAVLTAWSKRRRLLP